MFYNLARGNYIFRLTVAVNIDVIVTLNKQEVQRVCVRFLMQLEELSLDFRQSRESVVTSPVRCLKLCP